MKARLRIALVLMVTSTTAAAGPHLHAQASLGDELRAQSLLTDSKYTAVHVNNPKQAVWTIARHADPLGDFKVIVTIKDGMLITFVTVAEKAKIRRTPELDQRLLDMNHDYDYVKIGFDDDQDAYVRIDARLRIVDGREMHDIIEQVERTSQTLYRTLQPYLIR